jgi:hypothetical protein
MLGAVWSAGYALRAAAPEIVVARLPKRPAAMLALKIGEAHASRRRGRKHNRRRILDGRGWRGRERGEDRLAHGATMQALPVDPAQDRIARPANLRSDLRRGIALLPQPAHDLCVVLAPR